MNRKTGVGTEDMKKNIWVMLIMLCSIVGPAVARDALEEKFVHPPSSARPSGYWWWFNSLMDKDGITRDLQEFKAKGMGGVMMVWSSHGFGAGPIPQGPVFLSPEWRELYKHALREADRLGLEVGVNLCGGWCMGGPWITPENSGRWFLQSEIKLVGPQKFSGTLPLPEPKAGYDSPAQLNVAKFIGLPIDKVDYRDTAVVAFREPDGSQLRDERRKTLPAKSNRLDGDCFLQARQAMDQTLTPWTALPGDHPIAPGDVIDLTAELGPDGKLEWDVPEGTWTLLRTGHRITGIGVSLPVAGAEGLEVDWLSAAGVDQQWEHMAKLLLADAGPLAGKTLKYFATDSFEDGYPNWTATLLEQFKHYRGYDPTPYLPVLAGRLVGSADISERFLHDYRKTVADCMADNNYGHFAELARAHGMDTACEAAGPSWSGTMCMDGLKNLGRCAMPQGEFWRDLFVVNDQNQVGKQTATASHIYGRGTASAESFTSFQPHWNNTPEALKPIADRAFCEGINRIVFHTMTATCPQDGLPGYEYGAGTHFNPNVTWWQQAASSWISYINRCQALLQSGVFVADVLFYNGDWAPNLVEPKHVDSALGKGYDYDVCNAEVLLTRLSVKKGRIALPDGLNYRLLVLPDTKRMPAEVVKKLKDLVEAGATVVGPRPESDPGLKNYPQADADIKNMAAQVWGDCDGQAVKRHAFGKGRIIWGSSLREILAADGVPPDFVCSNNNAFIDFIHRRVGDAEVYFLANRNNQAEIVECLFRVAGKQPELWNPVTGTQRDLPEFESKDGRTTIPLLFEPYGSMAVVFRSKGPKAPGRQGTKVETADATLGSNFPKLKSVQELEGPWTVQFDPKWFYPTEGLGGDQAKGLMVFEKLDDWSKRAEPAIHHFGGTAVYRTAFSQAKTANSKSETGHAKSVQRLWLNLGVVANGTARVRLNGQDLGVVWCAPWRVEITGAVKSVGNTLEVEVVNLWPNRLIGDTALPEAERRTRTNVPVDSNQPLLSSGLLGPVRIMMAK